MPHQGSRAKGGLRGIAGAAGMDRLLLLGLTAGWALALPPWVPDKLLTPDKFLP